MTITGNPFLPNPDTVSAGTLVSGGGGDGYVDHVVAYVLQRINVRPESAVSSVVPAPGYRMFDLAELIAWAGSVAGVSPALPAEVDALRAHCYRNRTVLRDPDAGMRIKGALLFAPNAVGLSLGMRRRVIVHDYRSGVVIDEQRIRRWSESALIPGARGYR